MPQMQLRASWSSFKCQTHRLVYTEWWVAPKGTGIGSLWQPAVSQGQLKAWTCLTINDSKGYFFLVSVTCCNKVYKQCWKNELKSLLYSDCSHPCNVSFQPSLCRMDDCLQRKVLPFIKLGCRWLDWAVCQYALSLLSSEAWHFSCSNLFIHSFCRNQLDCISN